MMPIDITTVCKHSCAHCTRATRHTKTCNIDQSYFATVLRKLKDQKWPGVVGLIGGEPTEHKNFVNFCHLLHYYFPRYKCALFTSGGKKYEQYEDTIDMTFCNINYNDHSVPSYHQPLLLAGEDIIPNKKKREKYINRCWLQHQWCPCINENGGYFCEVAAVIDRFLGGNNGYNIKTKWWMRTPEQFKEQRDKLCKYCGIPYPSVRLRDTARHEFFTKQTIKLLRNYGSKRIEDEKNINILNQNKYETMLKLHSKFGKPQEYAKKNTKHHWVKKSWRMYLRNKWLSFPYWLKRNTIWRIT